MKPSLRSLRSALAMSLALAAGCYGDKVLSGAGGTAEGGAAHGGSSDGGAAAGAGGQGAAGDGGSGGISPPTECDGLPNGTVCDGPHPCEAYACFDGACVDTGPDEDVTIVSDPTSGDCAAMICNGGPDPVVGPDPDDAPDSEACFVGSCTNDVPTQSPVAEGTLCTGGVCDGALEPGGQGTGCVECLSWADCASGEVCSQGVCGTCTNDESCTGSPNGDSCNGVTCRCHTASDCYQSPAGNRCNGNGCGCLQSQDCDGADWGSQCNFPTCGCTTPNHCLDSNLGEACVAGHCGCNGDSDCSPGQDCDLLGHVCF